MGAGTRLTPGASQGSAVPSTVIRVGDALAVLRTLPDESAHCAVTSPPYWRLRDYAVEGQLGLEETPQAYVAALLPVFTELRRVLRRDGTLWLNVGDSYLGGRCGGQGPSGCMAGREKASRGRAASRLLNKRAPGMKAKNMAGIPWRLAFALQDDGWLLRSDCVWRKPSGLPEGVSDRPARNHEYVFLLSKAGRYFYDRDGVRQPHAEATLGFLGRETQARAYGRVESQDPSGRVGSGGWGASAEHAGAVRRPDPRGATLRTVWTISSDCYEGEHTAPMPVALASLAIQAGTSDGQCCAACGRPLQRIVELGEPDIELQRACGGDKNGEYHGEDRKGYAIKGAHGGAVAKARILSRLRKRTTVGWRRACQCPEGAGTRPALVLDPFGGSGTTALAASRLGRDSVLIELNPASAREAERRITADCPMFNRVEVVG